MASTRKSNRAKSLNSNSPVSSPSPYKRRRSSNPLVPEPEVSCSSIQNEVIVYNSIPTATDDEMNIVVDGIAEDAQIEVVEEEIIISDDLLHVSADANVIGEEVLAVPATESVPTTDLSETVLEQDSTSEKTNSFIFKDSTFVHSSKGNTANKKTRVWKNLKQIIAAERNLNWSPGAVPYGSIDAPPSFKPAKKYSDVSGLEALYTDPHTKMRYANTDEYRRIKILPGDIITGCLALRKANSIVS